MDVENLNNTTILAIWNDIKTFGSSFWAFIILFNIIILKDQWVALFKQLIEKIFKSNNHYKTYTKKDLLKHPIFNDLDYWLKIGIDALRLKETIHADDTDYVHNKETMAKEVIRIKYETMREYLKTFVEETDVDNIDSEVACKYILDVLTKEDLAQKRKFNERGIPQKFLSKFYVISDISRNIIEDAVKNFFSNKCESNTATKMYMALNTIDGYLNIIFSDLCETMCVINGDLKGELFDGKPMGIPATRIILNPPHPSYIFRAKEALNEILAEYNADRAFLVKYFEKDGLPFHSVVYEVDRPGVTAELPNIQMIDDSREKAMINLLETNDIVAADIAKYDTITTQRLITRGVKAMVMVPIFESNKLDGAVFLDYMNIDNFDDLLKRKDMDETLKKQANQLSVYIQYPANYEF